MKKQRFDPELAKFLEATLAKKPVDPVVLDLRGISDIADYFLICSGKSHRQVTAIAEHIEFTLGRERIRPLGTEGIREGHWALLDYGNVVIHVFLEDVRLFYDLEGLWAEAERIDIRSLAGEAGIVKGDQNG